MQLELCFVHSISEKKSGSKLKENLMSNHNSQLYNIKEKNEKPFILSIYVYSYLYVLWYKS